ncbi:Transthyretin-like family protein [Dictyocaulus viviparus]|uniref:Transthyretin-like family protein n=1 Tax=Dictyocaulus viviparus TaxID=29172 RepID=A0A0D8XIB9_DICVI|nr:Transthyretin-like family protein [Dictyocaulus viviparus]
MPIFLIHKSQSLCDADSGVDADDLMASGKTNSNGEFELRGYTEEFTPIDPKLNIYHDCNDFKRLISVANRLVIGTTSISYPCAYYKKSFDFSGT